MSLEEPVVMASVSPKHDTYPLIAASGVLSVSVLAGDQIDAGQYFSQPGRKFRYIAEEYLDVDGLPVVVDCIAWRRCETLVRKEMVRPRAVLRARRRIRIRPAQGGRGIEVDDTPDDDE